MPRSTPKRKAAAILLGLSMAACGDDVAVPVDLPRDTETATPGDGDEGTGPGSHDGATLDRPDTDATTDATGPAIDPADVRTTDAHDVAPPTPDLGTDPDFPRDASPDTPPRDTLSTDLGGADVNGNRDAIVSNDPTDVPHDTADTADTGVIGPIDPPICDLGPDIGLRIAPIGLTVDGAVQTSCTTASVRGLSQQLVDELECIAPGTLKSLASLPRTSLWSVVFPWAQTTAVDALGRAIARRSGATLEISSALRTLPQQYLLYRWYRLGRCGIALAAAPGLSNHNGGLAIDTPGYSGWRTALEAERWQWYGPGDEVHFTYVGPGTTDIRDTSVLAFQRLWNRNHPDRRLVEDGDFGPATESALRAAPADGFPIGPEAECGRPPPPAAALPFAWQRNLDGSWRFWSTPPAGVDRVEYLADGWPLDGSTRGESEGFEIAYEFEVLRTNRKLEARGFDASGALVARSVGWADILDGPGVFVRPIAPRTWVIGLDRAPTCVAAMKVDADGWELSDADGTGPIQRDLALRASFQQLGERTLTFTLLDADDDIVGWVERTVTLE